MRAEQGFTLLEMLVALAVLSLGALALLNLAGESTRQATAVEDRFFAGVVAENEAVEALTAPVAPALGEEGGEASLGGQTWRWTRAVSRTTDPGVLLIDVRVAPRGGRTAGEVTVFRGVP
ncbi:type II secretion system minor pseudopilin GspI [Phenylobacterium sp. J367]|uniref:type II secretion system minor pseudopilin GspI n=1 Tax=Phenylobacterium sp. J367 TaxID=2898435 RepID=UPI002150C223|nr:type II secretion system minor pseudopilin GspI [Phenylobacterium sp. J367]MCR5881093.1 type II secretion system minor pseudopilin GspI [Phenylobacterium sp. J367]